MRYLLLSVLIISLVSMLFVPDAFAAFQITDDETGGDCTSIGTWNSSSKTCILGSNITETVVIQSDGITFNGNGKLISATYVNCTDPSEENGIYINGFDNIVITNVNVNMGCKGILVDNSENIIIKDSTFSDLQSQTITLLNAVGVQISNNVLENNNVAISIGKAGSHDNVIKQNEINNTLQSAIILCEYSSNNLVFENVINGANIALGLCSWAENNEFFQNTVSNIKRAIAHGDGSYQTYGDPKGNKIYNNNLYEYHGIFDGIPNELLSLPLPVGGNYWSGYDSDAEGCTDSNYDNICDPQQMQNGYGQLGDIYNGFDALPWNIPDGWKTTTSSRVSIEDSTPPADMVVESPDGTAQEITFVDKTSTFLKLESVPNVFESKGSNSEAAVRFVGQLLTSDRNTPIGGAQIELIDTKFNKSFMLITDVNGKFSATWDWAVGNNYGVYAFYDGSNSLKFESSKSQTESFDVRTAPLQSQPPSSEPVIQNWGAVLFWIVIIMVVVVVVVRKLKKRKERSIQYQPAGGSGQQQAYQQAPPKPKRSFRIRKPKPKVQPQAQPDYDVDTNHCLNCGKGFMEKQPNGTKRCNHCSWDPTKS